MKYTYRIITFPFFVAMIPAMLLLLAITPIVFLVLWLDSVKWPRSWKEFMDRMDGGMQFWLDAITFGKIKDKS